MEKPEIKFLETIEGKRILEHNLSMLEIEMPIEFNQESVGGNAGWIDFEGEPMPCAGVHSSADFATGEIKSFGLYMDHTTVYDRPENERGFILRVASPVPDNNKFFRITENPELGGFSKRAKETLLESFRQFNLKHGTVLWTK